MTAWIMRLGRHDEALLHALVARRRGWLDLLLRRLTHVGDAQETIPLAAALTAWFWPKGTPEDAP